MVMRGRVYVNFHTGRWVGLRSSGWMVCGTIPQWTVKRLKRIVSIICSKTQTRNVVVVVGDRARMKRWDSASPLVSLWHLHKSQALLPFLFAQPTTFFSLPRLMAFILLLTECCSYTFANYCYPGLESFSQLCSKTI